MTRAKRQRLSLGRRDSTAAYAASQPLFTALRHTVSNSLPRQTSSLTTARDLVQSLHVGLQNDDNYNDQQRHAKYMDTIVEAWRSSTEAFCALFEEMVKITGEKPEEGRAAGERNGAFVSMLEAAQRARDGARAYVSQYEKQKDEPEPVKETTVEDENGEETEGIAVGMDTDSGDEIDLAHKRPSAVPEKAAPRPQADAVPVQTADSRPASAVPAITPKKTTSKVKLDKSGTQVLWEKGASLPKVPFALLSNAEKKEWLKEQAKQKREKQKGKVQEIKKAHQNKDSNKAPRDTQLHYEDVAAEVEARIKAKTEAKKSKKAEKKRKRDSGDSFVNPGAESEVGDTIEVKQVSEKPSKKRVRPLVEEDEVSVKPSASANGVNGGATAIPDGDTVHVGRKAKRGPRADGYGEESEIVVKKRKKRNKD